MAGWDGTMLTYPFTKIAKNGNGDLQQALCTSKMKQSEIFAYGVISKWARYKPIVAANKLFVTEADRKAVNFGLSASQQTDPSIAALAGWTYQRPTTWLRALDFVKMSDAGVPSTTIGYYPSVGAPCPGYVASHGTSQLTTYMYFKGQTTQDQINMWAISVGNDYGISFAEMGGLASWYFCIVVEVRRNNVTKQYMLTSSQNIGAGASDPSITDWQTILVPRDDSIFSVETTYDAFAVLANKSKTSWFNVANDRTLRFLPLPLDNQLDAQFLWQVNSASANAWISSAYRVTRGTLQERRKIYYTIMGRNTGTVPVSVPTLYIDLVSCADPEDVWDATIIRRKTYVGGISIQVGTSVIDSGDNAYIQDQAIPDLQEGQIYLRIQGYNSGGTRIFASFTNVPDQGVTPDPDPGPIDRE